jgi:protein PhnA
MTATPACPVCGMENTYPDADRLVCADCGHEWQPADDAAADADAASSDEPLADVRDAHGQTLANGDTVVLIKDLKVKGSGSALKIGSRIKGIRLVPGDHPIDCRVDGGKYLLKSEFVKKA